MISYQIYKLIHLFGIFVSLTALAGLAFAAVQGDLAKHPWRKLAAISHGIGLFLVLLGGFGMAARLGIVSGLPGWIYGKLFLWALLGVLLVIVKRRSSLAGPIWVASSFVALAAGYLALYKPF